MNGQAPNVYTIGVMLLVIAIALAFRARRMARPMPLSTRSLVIVPLLFAAITAATLAQFPPQGMGWLWVGLSFAAGAALGWQRGKLMKIWIEKDTGKAMAQGSMWALIFLGVLIVGRGALRMGLDYEAQSGAVDAGLVSDAFVVFALGLFGVQRIEMAIRAKRLREEG
ncbi:CcdC protein domain-containing protein [Tsuneonella mangrovi]|uniref:CcdC protein domain-containing protein n=1 Tax=Tsuneonella mangrovi TaxID=1982042 RepID=UPI000BA27256|nr:CcdC protein domain-containing protein [Tsuneonella mangrovi]